MKLLLILISIMTFTVESKTSVKMEGTWPYDIQVSYANTYNKGQVRKDDVATLTLGHLDGITIEKVELAMRANATSGAAKITVQADGAEWATKNVTHETVCEAVEVYKGAKSAQQLVIRVEGITNSIYVDAFTITWSQVQQQAHTVTLMNGTEQYAQLTEAQGGAGVQLPKLPDIENWRFVAWTAEPFEEQSTMSTSWINHGTYLPKSDETLWAVYEYRQTIEPTEVTELQDGVYVYADTKTNKAMSGGIVSGVAGSAEMELDNTNQWYAVTFTTDSTATIQLMYTYEYIGYAGTQLASELSEWSVYHDGTKTAFYTVIKGKTYMLHPDYLKVAGGEYTYCAALVQVNDLTNTPTALYAVTPMEEPLYSCYPNGKQAVEDVQAEHRPYVLYFGNYELRIENGRKSIKLLY